MSIVYVVLAMTVMVAFASLGVDLAKVRVVKVELQSAADAAAMYAAAGMDQGATVATSRAITAAGDNKAYASSIVVTSSDVEFGTWNPSTKTFTVVTGSAANSATAVRVTCRRAASRGTAVPMTFAQVVGFAQIDVKASAIATRGQVVTANVDADSCPWLAGMPSGTHVSAYGGNTQDAISPAQNPYQVSGLPITAGQSMYFKQCGGQTSYMNAADYGPDGETDWIVRQNPCNGINATSAPLNCLVGIFLNDNAPTSTSMAPELDYSSSNSRNQASYSPQLKQVFFIGDGMDSSGNLQEFVVPTGATRLYLCIMDEKGWWWDNTGQLQTTLMNSKVQLVK